MDHYRINQILLNIVGNSVKFTEKGSIKITVDFQEKDRVDENCFYPYPFSDEEGIFEKEQNILSYTENYDIFGLRPSSKSLNKCTPPIQRNKGILKITVIDSGIGMNSTDLSKLFQKFTQVSETSRRKLGTGLGLFITKQLCQKMGGDVRAFSKKEKGSAFIICIPVEVVQDQMPIRVSPEAIQTTLMRKNFKALVVDDVQDNIAVLSTYFSKIAIGIADSANDGLSAFKKYVSLVEKGQQPKIVTMDIYMPNGDGKTAARKIREFERVFNLPNCLLIMVSGNCSDSEINECLNKDGEIRADAFLKKPVSFEELVNVIATQISNIF